MAHLIWTMENMVLYCVYYKNQAVYVVLYLSKVCITTIINAFLLYFMYGFNIFKDTALLHSMLNLELQLNRAYILHKNSPTCLLGI